MSVQQVHQPQSPCRLESTRRVLWSAAYGGIGPNSSFPGKGWVWRNGTFSTMNPTLPGNPAGACCWSVTGISNTGVLAGLLFQSDFWQAWMKAGTDQDFFTYPTVNQCCDTTATGVNS